MLRLSRTSLINELRLFSEQALQTCLETWRHIHNKLWGLLGNNQSVTSRQAESETYQVFIPKPQILLANFGGRTVLIDDYENCGSGCCRKTGPSGSSGQSSLARAAVSTELLFDANENESCLSVVWVLPENVHYFCSSCNRARAGAVHVWPKMSPRFLSLPSHVF